MIHPATIPKIIICPKCKGEGEINVPNMRENHNHDKAVCPDCGGKKLLKRIVTIKFEKI